MEEIKNASIIGCGNLGKAILKGLLANNAAASMKITATKRDTSALAELQHENLNITNDNVVALKNSDLIVVALKPHNILEILAELKEHFDPQRHVLVSCATGITIAQLQEAVGNDLPVFRAMPNTAADVQGSITCICGNSNDKVEPVKTFFDNIGSSIVINEELMEAATVLGACGIAFVLRFMRAMVQGGVQIGFDAKTASAIVNQTVKGAAELLIEGNEHPEFEIDKVTTPKGCTISGLNEMEHNGFSSALIKGITTSYQLIEK